MEEARRLKERTYPELVATNGRVRMVVLAIELGGRWSSEAVEFIDLLAAAKVRSEPLLLRASAQQAWKRRWINILTNASQTALATSLLEMPPSRAHNVDGETPSLRDVFANSRWSSPPDFSKLY